MPRQVNGKKTVISTNGTATTGLPHAKELSLLSLKLYAKITQNGSDINVRHESPKLLEETMEI